MSSDLVGCFLFKQSQVFDDVSVLGCSFYLGCLFIDGIFTGEYDHSPKERFATISVDHSRQIIATSAEVTPNGSLLMESSPSALNPGLGLIAICPDAWYINLHKVGPGSSCKLPMYKAIYKGYNFIYTW